MRKETMTKIAVYTIALNEEKHVERWYESSKDADYHFMLDTGSQDDTVNIAKNLGIVTATATISPWRFDVARNTALSLLPKDIDYCISMDMDEIIMPGWRKELENAFLQGATLPKITFTFSFNPDGSPAYQFGATRIHARNGYTWKHPIHEGIVPYQIQEKQVRTNIEMQHHPDKNKSRAQYLPMLEWAVKEDPDNARMAFYYGRELMYYGKTSQAIQQLSYFLNMPSATWKGDRSDAMIYISKCSSDLLEAERWAYMAINEVPERREGYARLATVLYHGRNYAMGLKYAEQALSITERPLQYMCEDWAWNWEIYDIAAICAWETGDKEKAIKYGSKAVEIAPNEQRLVQNMQFFLE
jgi:glycosyltransferase involved in cell wall biosynthesis